MAYFSLKLTFSKFLCTLLYYSDPNNLILPNYTLYTGLTSKQSLIIFVSLWVCQVFCLWLKNVLTSKPFKTLHFFDQMTHSFQSVLTPAPSVDWGKTQGDVAQHLAAMKMIQREVKSTILINAIFQVIHAIPMFYLGKLLLYFLFEKLTQ